MSVLFYKGVFEKMEKMCQTEYSKGTAMARLWFGVLAGYFQRNVMVMCD
jgi:hypothetical protein